MSGDPNLTDEEKRELLRQLQLPDDEWEPIELPEGSEPVSATIIRSRDHSLLAADGLFHNARSTLC